MTIRSQSELRSVMLECMLNNKEAKTETIWFALWLQVASDALGERSPKSWLYWGMI
ncbi:MAG: hypothetical protein GDA38_26400 [Hormoscilla sp. SP12CHS1]|nr:hypothetical protein [Hormoscilla sp. SP12CHS1]